MTALTLLDVTAERQTGFDRSRRASYAAAGLGAAAAERLLRDALGDAAD